MIKTIIYLLICFYFSEIHSSDGQLPEQIHLALGENPSTISVTWVTQQSTLLSTVYYGLSELNLVKTGIQTIFQDEGSESRKFYIHRVFIEDLIAGNMYYYKCGSENGWSDTFTFQALPTHSYWSPRIAVIGDMGTVNARALPELMNEVVRLKNFDAIFHVGDFAYNMDSDNSRNGDFFMRLIEPIAARVPYMTSVGNHEAGYNFSNYRKRFTMPGGDGESQFYSFNIGPAHIISYSSEFYYYILYGWNQIVRQYEWLINDLKEANKPENRRLRPWIIAMGHRPMYCSNSGDVMHCDFVNNVIRTGFLYKNGSYALGLESLLYENGVDLIIGAHEHSYERFWPVYNRTVCNSTTDKNPYIDPDAPVHIVTGSAGCSEGEDPFDKLEKPWTAFRSEDYGFTRMNIINSTHLYLEQISVEKDDIEAVIDSFTIVKHKHGPGLYTCHEKSPQYN